MRLSVAERERERERQSPTSRKTVDLRMRHHLVIANLSESGTLASILNF